MLSEPESPEWSKGEVSGGNRMISLKTEMLRFAQHGMVAIKQVG